MDMKKKWYPSMNQWERPWAIGPSVQRLQTKKKRFDDYQTNGVANKNGDSNNHVDFTIRTAQRKCKDKQVEQQTYYIHHIVANGPVSNDKQTSVNRDCCYTSYVFTKASSSDFPRKQVILKFR
jgi:hypothetical protein